MDKIHLFIMVIGHTGIGEANQKWAQTEYKKDWQHAYNYYIAAIAG